MSKAYTTPYVHYTIPNFLKQKEYDRLTNIYDNLQFL